MSDPSVLLDIRGISRTFGHTRALDEVSVAIASGSVHAFVGENGAGKSTLGRIIAGVLPPDAGELVLRGEPVTFASPRDALEQGIALVAQELALVPQLTAAENVFLGVEPRRASVIDRRALRARYEALAERAGFDIPADARVGGLPIGARQQVEILRALAREADLIVLDEPTASLAAPDAERLHDIVRSLVAAGRTVVLVSHFLGEVLDLADSLTILRDGRVVRTGPATTETEASLIEGMLGRSGDRTWPTKRPPVTDAPLVLQVVDLRGPGVNGVSLEVRAGEIVGLAGLIGAGRTELIHCIQGAAPRTGGQVLLSGAPAPRTPGGAFRAGMALIPESRADEGLCLGRPVRENASLASLPILGRLGFVRRREERERVGDSLRRVAGTSHIELPVRALSGGNQQKVLFARAFLERPALLLADEPTRGIDVGAKREIHELLVRFAAEGGAVLLASSELEEILGLAHRALVMRGGRIVTGLVGDDLTERAILDASFGMPSAA